MVRKTLLGMLIFLLLFKAYEKGTSELSCLLEPKKQHGFDNGLGILNTDFDKEVPTNRLKGSF